MSYHGTRLVDVLMDGVVHFSEVGACAKGAARPGEHCDRRLALDGSHHPTTGRRVSLGWDSDNQAPRRRGPTVSSESKARKASRRASPVARSTALRRSGRLMVIVVTGPFLATCIGRSPDGQLAAQGAGQPELRSPA